MPSDRGRAGGAHRRAFGDRIRLLRLERELSQEALAEHSGLHRNYVSGVERGKINLSLDNIYALADGLGVPAHDLLLPTEPNEAQRAAAAPRAQRRPSGAK